MIKTVKAALYVVPVPNLLAFSSQPNPMIPECTAIPPASLFHSSDWMEGGKEEKGNRGRLLELMRQGL